MCKRIIIALIFSVVLLASCTQHKKIVYLQELSKENETQNFQNSDSLIYKIIKGDILYVKVISIDEKISSIFNTSTNTGYSSTLQNETSLYLNSYSVDENGRINMPIIGAVDVVNLTISETQKIIQSKVDELLKDATVIVKLVSYKYTVLGEVRRPGVFKNYNDRLSILEAIGQSGDITDYGNRQNIIVMRPTANGYETFRVDLTDNSLISSEKMYILPNDVIYVESLKSKAFRVNAPNISIILSSITTLVLVLNYLK